MTESCDNPLSFNLYKVNSDDLSATILLGGFKFVQDGILLIQITFGQK